MSAPRMLTVAEVDAIIARKAERERGSWTSLPTQDEVQALARMARAMAVMQEAGASVDYYGPAGPGGAAWWETYNDERAGSYGFGTGPTLVEAVEAAMEAT